MNKYFDVYKPPVWFWDEERAMYYPGEQEPMYWDYVDWYEENAKHNRTIDLKKAT